VKIIIKTLLASVLIGTVALAAPAKHNPTAPIYASVDGWTPWASSVTPPPPQIR
jgi:hypothetical protein